MSTIHIYFVMNTLMMIMMRNRRQCQRQMWRLRFFMSFPCCQIVVCSLDRLCMQQTQAETLTRCHNHTQFLGHAASLAHDIIHLLQMWLLALYCTWHLEWHGTKCRGRSTPQFAREVQDLHLLLETNQSHQLPVFFSPIRQNDEKQP